jgi:uncharacterized ferritin-like protein (DUF455 family)
MYPRSTQTAPTQLRQKAYEILCIPDPIIKCDEVQELYKKTLNDLYIVDTLEQIVEENFLVPGRPSKPELVNPLSVKKRSMHTTEGRAIAIHALAHIEFNAINLALDAVWRFTNMPKQYYLDWIKVAAEEAKHFLLLKKHLISLGFDYGAFPAHDSLWEMVEKTRGDVVARMALVPRTMEARGLDAVPMIRDRFIQVKDVDMVEILDTILHDEISHVEIGNRWFHYLCEMNHVDSIDTFQRLCIQYRAPNLRGPFNISARKLAGFTDQELDLLIQSGN